MHSQQFSTVIFAISKEDGGVLMTEVGNTLRRLATKVGAKSISASIGEALRPVQLVVSSKMDVRQQPTQPANMRERHCTGR